MVALPCLAYYLWIMFISSKSASRTGTFSVSRCAETVPHSFPVASAGTQGRRTQSKTETPHTFAALGGHLAKHREFNEDDNEECGPVSSKEAQQTGSSADVHVR